MPACCSLAQEARDDVDGVMLSLQEYAEYMSLLWFYNGY